MRVRNDSFSHTMVFKTRGRLLARALAVLFIAAIIAQFLHTVFARELVNAPAPDFALKSTSGENIRLSEFRGDVVALTFGASWCVDCQTALRALEGMGQRMHAQGLQLLAVDFDHDPRAAAGVAAGLQQRFPVLADPEGVAGRLYDINTLPVIVLIDRNGKVQAMQEGFRSGDESALRDQLGKLLAD